MTYTILKAADGSGENPGDTDPDNPNQGGSTGDGNRTDLSGLPLWQLIVSGVSTLLFLFCAGKSYGNMSKAKAAKKEAKELASQSYAVNYGFAPLPLLAIGSFLGMEESTWTIIACVTLG